MYSVFASQNYSWRALHSLYCLYIFQVKAYGPGLQSSGLAVGKPAEFTVDAKLGGKAPLKIQAQVCIGIILSCTNTIETRRKIMIAFLLNLRIEMETQSMCRLRIMVMEHTAAATPLASLLNTQSQYPGVESISRKAHSGSVNVEL